MVLGRHYLIALVCAALLGVVFLIHTASEHGDQKLKSAASHVELAQMSEARTQAADALAAVTLPGSLRRAPDSMDCKTTAMLKCLTTTLHPSQALSPLRTAMQQAGLNPTRVDCHLPRPHVSSPLAASWRPPWKPCRVLAKASNGAVVSASAFPAHFSAVGTRWSPPYDGTTVQVAAVPAF